MVTVFSRQRADNESIGLPICKLNYHTQDMDWHDLPPLAALRAFEALGRNGSFSAAARDLNVTHAAVAQQVRNLEAHLGLALALREGRGITLTDDGQRLADGLSEGFATIANRIADLRSDKEGRPLHVSLTPSFASKWLMPRLGSFWAAHPGVPISLHPDRKLVDLRRDGMDLAIRFGTGDWPGLDATVLMPATFVVVGAPVLLDGPDLLDISQMQALPWVLEADWAEQFVWLKRIGLDVNALEQRVFDTEELAREAARLGYGLYLALETTVARDVEAGQLLPVHRHVLTDTGYYIVTLEGDRNPRLRQFVRWLKSQSR